MGVQAGNAERVPRDAHPIEFEGLVKRFGSRTVLNDLSFHVPEGSIVGLLGPNGAGKSTAMRVLLGLQKASAGTVRVLGHEPGTRGFRAAVRSVGAIIESPPLYKNISALANLEIRVAAMGLSTKDAQVRDILNQVGLADRADDRCGDFSLGMRQRLGLGLALVGEPKVVVLDEPTNGLDPGGTVEMRNLILALPSRGATTLLCTHRLSEVERTCDYVVVLRGGHLITQGSIEEIIAGASGSGIDVGVATPELETAVRVVSDVVDGEVQVRDGTIVTARSLDDPSVITRALAREGIYLRELHTRRATLEEAFLELTSEDEERA